jgi:hypothetical protein
MRQKDKLSVSVNGINSNEFMDNKRNEAYDKQGHT